VPHRPSPRRAGPGQERRDGRIHTSKVSGTERVIPADLVIRLVDRYLMNGETYLS